MSQRSVSCTLMVSLTRQVVRENLARVRASMNSNALTSTLVLPSLTMVVQVVDAADLARLETDWSELLPDSPEAVFLSLEWCQLVWDTFGHEPRTAVYVVRDRGKPVGLLPVWRRRMNRFGLFRRVSEAYGGRRGDYSHPLLSDCSDERALRALLRAAITGAQQDGALILPNVPADGDWSERVRAALVAEGVQFTETQAECFRTRLPSTFREFTEAVQGKFRREVRRRLRKLEEDLGSATLERVRSPAEARRLLPVFFEMHDRRWVQAGQPGAFSDPDMRRYFFAMVDHLWDRLHVSVLQAGDTAAAISFGMTSGRALLFFKTTFDTELSGYAPGKVQMWLIFQEAIEEGLGLVDFLQGEEAYKGEWATHSMTTSTFVVKTKRPSFTYWWLTEGRGQAEKTFGKLYLRFATLVARLRRRLRPP